MNEQNIDKYLSYALMIAGLALLGLAAHYLLLHNTWRAVLGSIGNGVISTGGIFGDFTDIYYRTGRKIFVYKTPSHGFFYPSIVAIGLGVFSRMSPGKAVLIWGMFQTIVTGLMCLIPGYALFRVTRLRTAGVLYAFLAILSYPLIHGFVWGQMSCLAMLCVFCSLFLYQLNLKRWAALFIALAASLKIYPVIFILYFVYKREIGLIKAFLIMLFILVVVVPAVVLGIGESIHFWKCTNLLLTTSMDTWMKTHPGSNYFIHVVDRLIGRPVGGVSHIFLLGAGFLVAVINFVLIAWIDKNPVKHKATLSFGLIFTASPFLVYTSWPHYFAYLPFYQVFLCYLFYNKNNILLKYSVIGLLILPSMILSNVSLYIDTLRWDEIGGLFFSNLAILSAIYGHVLSMKSGD
ncbi:MAG TPA: glycosyltransferase family 87 protein [Elusimicrobiota bacterium]|nr:glycosyltransferase family 87 protein [Elusimicrobiota bacterium]